MSLTGTGETPVGSAGWGGLTTVGDVVQTVAFLALLFVLPMQLALLILIPAARYMRLLFRDVAMFLALISPNITWLVTADDDFLVLATIQVTFALTLSRPPGRTVAVEAPAHVGTAAAAND